MEGSFPKSDSGENALLYSSELNLVEYLMKNFIELYDEIITDGDVTITQANFFNLFREIFVNRNEITIGDQSNVVIFDSGTIASANDVTILAMDYDATPAEDCDFTGAVMDTDWTLATGGGGADKGSVLDTTNDEVDCYVNNANDDATATMTYTGAVSVTNGFVAVFAVRNVSVVASGTAEVCGVTITNAELWSYGGQTASVGTNPYIRITSIKTGTSHYYRKVEYSPDGSSWTLLAEAHETAHPDIKIHVTRPSSSNSAYVSIYVARIYNEFESTGYYVSNTQTSTGNAKVVYGKITTTGTGSGADAVLSVSANNGSNYTNITNNDFGLIGTTGTQIKGKVTLTRSTDKLTSPILSKVLLGWTR